ncbi:MAG: DUF3450 family protein [Phycisphaerales bacterium]
MAGLLAAPAAAQTATTPTAADVRSSLEETRVTLAKWIETQQIISRERNEWQQGKEILQGRIELVGKEVSQLKESIAKAETAVAESNKKRDQLQAETARLKEVSAQLNTAVTGMETDVRALAKRMPEHVATRIAPLIQRIPADPATTRITTAERFQNVLGILNELNKANSEINVVSELRTLADGSTSEVQVIYVGLAQAYYMSPRGEAGVGHPTDTGWEWKPAPEAASSILAALEIVEGKSSPAFVPLPVSIQ